MKYVLAILITALALTACGQDLLGNATANVTDNESVEPVVDVEAPTPGPDGMETPDMSDEAPDADGMETPADEGLFTVTRTEGELIKLSPQAVDPDGDEITYTFSEPFDSTGTWQTEVGDAGTYDVTITARDEKGATNSVEVRVIVERSNRAPNVVCPERLLVNEGEVVTIDCTVDDPEGDEVDVSYDGWMGKQRQTTYNDAGEHEVTVTFDDGMNVVQRDITIEVRDVNRAPVFPLDYPSQLVAQEGDVLTLDTGSVTDPDNDELSFTFSQPFNDEGVWQTEVGDAGTYNVDVVASDGETTTKKRVEVTVEMRNTAPVLERIEDITVYEGERIELPLEASDREGDELTYTITGYMDSTAYVPGYDEAGSYTTKVTVTDGEFEKSQVVHITVLDRNRPPVFRVPA